MGRGRSTLLLLAVLLGLVGYIYFYESKRTPGEDDARPKVFTVAADKITEVAVRHADERTLVRRQGKEWSIVEPVNAAADDAEVSGLTNALATLEEQRVVDASATNLAEYGLAEPRVEVAFKAEGDQERRRLLIGDKTATGGDLYARRADAQKVILIPGYLESTFARSTFDLRDKTVLRFDRDKVDRIAVGAPGSPVVLAKVNDDWTVTSPVKARGDFGAIEGLLSRLQSAQMRTIATSEAADLKKFGLEKPSATATLQAGSSQARLLIGSKADEGTVYAKDASRPLVFTVESSLLDDLRKDAADYRRKDVFEFRAYNATRLELTRDGQTTVLEAVKDKKDSNAAPKWRRTAPGAAADLDPAKVDTLLSRLSGLRAASFIPEREAPAVKNPSLVIEARYDEGKRDERVTFVRSGGDLYAVRAGEPGAAKLEGSEFDEVLKALDALK